MKIDKIIIIPIIITIILGSLFIFICISENNRINNIDDSYSAFRSMESVFSFFGMILTGGVLWFETMITWAIYAFYCDIKDTYNGNGKNKNITLFFEIIGMVALLFLFYKFLGDIAVIVSKFI